MSSILIVDDHAIVREPLARLLRLEGYRTFSAVNGNDAITMLHGETIDLVLLDLMMPKKDGIGFLECLRQDARWTKLPVIVMTAAVEGSQLDRARILTGDNIFFKARFNVEELFTRIRNCLLSHGNAA